MDKDKKIKILLLLIFFLGLILRLYNFKDNFIFAYDQARDAQRIYEIINFRDIKIVGPETDIPGIFNGPLFYYLLLPVYALSNFDANYAALLMILINLSGIPILFWLSKTLFNNKKVGIIAAFLWSISYFQLNFSRYISNASPLSITVALFFLGWAFYLFKNKKAGLLLSAISLGAATHFDIYLLYLVVLYPIFYLIFRDKVKTKDMIKSLSYLVLTLSTFIIAEIKWKFLGTRSLIGYFTGQQKTPLPIIESFTRYLEKLTEAFYFSFLSFNKFLVFLSISFLIYLALKSIKKKGVKTFLIIWLFSTLPLFGFSSGVLTVPVINTSIIPVITLLVALGIYQIYKISIIASLLILTVFFVNNLSLVIKDPNYTNMLVKTPLLYKDEKKAIDYTYNQAKGKKFSICGVTNPLFINTVWSYLYKTYGEKKYGYLPFWAGQKQYLNRSFLPYDKEKPKLRFLILEPLIGIPDYSQKATVFLEDHVSELVEEKQFGHLKIQKRILREKPLPVTKKELEKSGLKGVIESDPRYSCFIDYE